MRRPYPCLVERNLLSTPQPVQTAYDYIIIGSGIAGLNTALLAAERGSVLVVTKGRIDDCNSRYAQGGIAAAIGPGDAAPAGYSRSGRRPVRSGRCGRAHRLGAGQHRQPNPMGRSL